MRFEIVTIFPGFFASIFENGILRRALAEGLVEVGIHDLRAFTHDRHRTVDDRPFGGGEGMVLKPEPIAAALASIGVEPKFTEASQENSARPTVILLSAQGRPFTQSLAREIASLDRVVLLCGRYEGVDERINQLYCDMEFSIGDYVLSGGELAAAVVIDAAMRLLPGVLGNEASRRPARLSPLHPPRRICRTQGPRTAPQRRPPGHPPLAPRAAIAQNPRQPPRPAGTRQASRRSKPQRSGVPGANPASAPAGLSFQQFQEQKAVILSIPTRAASYGEE